INESKGAGREAIALTASDGHCPRVTHLQIIRLARLPVARSPSVVDPAESVGAGPAITERRTVTPGTKSGWLRKAPGSDLDIFGRYIFLIDVQRLWRNRR